MENQLEGCATKMENKLKERSGKETQMEGKIKGMTNKSKEKQ